MMISAQLRRTRTASRVLAAALFVGTTVGSSPIATPVVGAGDGKFDDRAEHCAVSLDTGSRVCVVDEADLPQAVLKATGKVLEYGEIDMRDNALATYAVGTIYSYPNYGGRSNTVTVSSSCSAGYSYTYVDLGAIGWNDDIDSFKSYSGCQTKIWENTGFSGASYGYVTNSTDVGSMKNRASSIRWG